MNKNETLNLSKLIEEGNKIINDSEHDFVNLTKTAKWVQMSKTYLHRVINDKYQLRMFQTIADNPANRASYNLNQVLQMVGILESCQLIPLDYRRIDDKYILLRNILQNFNKFEVESKRRTRNRSEKCNEFKDEYDIQDALFSILKLFFNDIRREDYVPSFGGSNSIIDFYLPEIKTGLEIKFANENLTVKKINEQISVDIQLYYGRVDMEFIIFFIYDPKSLLKNVESLKDLEINKNIEIILCP